MSARSDRRDVPAPSRAYWTGQSLLALTLVLMGVVSGQFAPADTRIPLPRTLAFGLLASFLVVAVTHALRPVVLADVATLATLRGRLPKRLLSLLAIGVTASAADLLGQWAILHGPESAWPPALSVLLTNGVTWASVFATWCVAYGTSQLVVVSTRASAEAMALRAAARDAEARALRAQMDPHFLFNAINSARALVGVDPDGARELLTRYAEVLRYVLMRSGGTSVTLGEELEVARAYLEIERQRFPDRLRIEIEVPEAVRTTVIPPLLLQTLVENAVRHGIARLADGGTVRVAARAIGDTLELTVSYPAPSVVEGGHEHGIGLENSRERLRLLHGERATLAFSRRSDGVVTVALRLPLPRPARVAER